MFSAGWRCGMRFPVEIAAVDDDAADRGAVAADIFRRRIHHHRRAVVERAHQHRRRGVVHDQRDAERAADGGDLGDRERRSASGSAASRHSRRGCGHRWRGRTPRDPSGSTKRVSMPWSFSVLANKFQVPPYRSVELTMLSPARARFCTENAEAAWPEATASAADAALDRRQPLLQHVVGRVHDAGVDVAEFLQAEQVGGMLGAVELVGGGLVDRHRNGMGGAVAAPAGVQGEGFGVFAGVMMGRSSVQVGRAL